MCTKDKMPPCEIDGCDARVWQRTKGKFLCVSHWQKLAKYGDPLLNHPRFRRKLKWIEDNSGYLGADCLKWPFSVSSHGRGTVQLNGKTITAPRMMCIVAHGAPPTKKHHAAHSCGNGHLGCMNPNHICWKTPVENESDKITHGTLRKGSDINTSKLSEDDVRAIRAMIGRVSGVKIAKLWGITPAMVSNIKLGKAWGWLK